MMILLLKSIKLYLLKIWIMNQTATMINQKINGDKDVIKALKYSVVSSVLTIPKSWINQSTDKNIWALCPTVFTPWKKLFKLLGNVKLNEAADVTTWK